MTDYVVGLDLGGTKLLAGAVGADGAVAHRARRPALGLDARALMEMVCQAVHEAAAAVDGPVRAVGIGIPCTIDQRTGMAVWAVNLPLHDVAFRDLVAERLGVPVVVDNDANCAMEAEGRVGAAAGDQVAAMLTIGTGIGGGLWIGGRTFRGAFGAGAELGHMVVDIDGPPCQGFCPNRGCLEAVASGTALVREAALALVEHPHGTLASTLAGGRPLTGPLVTELAHAGDPVCRDVIALIGRRLGVGIANLVNMLNPETVVVGGGVIAAGELLLGPARDELAARALAPGRDMARVSAAHFGAEAGMQGAAMLARQALAGTGELTASGTGAAVRT